MIGVDFERLAVGFDRLAKPALQLPQLPEQVRYRFVGRDLILRDTEANVILDYIKNVLPPAAAR